MHLETKAEKACLMQPVSISEGSGHRPDWHHRVCRMIIRDLIRLEVHADTRRMHGRGGDYPTRSSAYR